MSSQSSSNTPSASQPQPPDADGLATALALVAENSFFACALPIGQPAFEAWCADAGAVPWVRIGVSFAGTFDGGIDIDLPESLGSRLLSAFAGLGDEEGTPDAEVRDMMGEFANMVCGSWLTQSRRGDRFDLTPPSVQYHKAGPPPAPAKHLAGTVHAAIDDVPLRVSLTITAHEESSAA